MSSFLCHLFFFALGHQLLFLSNFNIKYRPFSCAMTGIGLLYPALYASVLVIYKSSPKCVKLCVKRYVKRFTSENYDQHEDALLEVGVENDDAFLLDRN